MPQRCTVCDHKKLREIDLLLVQAKLSKRSIAAQFQLAPSSVQRHKAEHLPETLKRGHEARKDGDALAVMTELEKCVTYTNKMLRACDAWLSDPENPGIYTLEPRAEELIVIYYSAGEGDGKPIRKRAPLSQLLAQIQSNGKVIESYEVKRADPRDLILKTVAQLRPQAELLAKLEGKLKDNPNINITINQEWVEVRAAILAALLPFPDARMAVVSALSMMEGNGGKRIHSV